MIVDVEKLRAVIAARGECAGPRTTFPAPGQSEVTIFCRDNYVEVIEWLAAMERDIPALLDRVATLERERDEAWECRDAEVQTKLRLARAINDDRDAALAEVERLTKALTTIAEGPGGDLHGDVRAGFARGVALAALGGDEK